MVLDAESKTLRPVLSSDHLTRNQEVMAGSSKHKVYAQLSPKLEPLGIQASLRSLFSIDTDLQSPSERLFKQYEFAQDVRRRLGSEVSILQASAAQLKPFTEKAYQREQKYLAFQSALISRVLSNMNDDGDWKAGRNPFPRDDNVSDMIPTLKEDDDSYGEVPVKSNDIYFSGSVSDMAESFRKQLATKTRCLDSRTGEHRWRSDSGLWVAPMKTWCAMSLLKHQLMRVMPLVLLERKDGPAVEGKIYADYLDSNIGSLKGQLSGIMRQVFEAAGLEDQEISELLDETGNAEEVREQTTAASRRHNALNQLFDHALTAIATDWTRRDQAVDQPTRNGLVEKLQNALTEANKFADSPVKTDIKSALTQAIKNSDALTVSPGSRPRLVETASVNQSQAFIAKAHFDRPGEPGVWNLELPSKLLQQYDLHPLQEDSVTKAENKELQSRPLPLVFILDPDGNIKLCRHKDTHYHHSTPDGGRPAMTAGELKGVFHGDPNGKTYYRVTEVKNKSGHFWPSVDSLQQLKKTLVQSGMNATSATWIAEQSPSEVKKIVARWTHEPKEYARCIIDPSEKLPDTGKLNIVIQPQFSGQYHIRIFDDSGKSSDYTSHSPQQKEAIESVLSNSLKVEGQAFNDLIESLFWEIPEHLTLAKADKDNIKEALTHIDRGMNKPNATPAARLLSSKSDPQLSLRAMSQSSGQHELRLDSILELKESVGSAKQLDKNAAA
jgi:hypothetical protein